MPARPSYSPLGHGDGQPTFGDRIHRRRDDGDVQTDFAGEPCGGVDLRQHDVRRAEFDQNVVEGEPFANLREILHFASRV